jgi:uncharacterized membrane protein HdeD (DUF308 family)
MEEGIMNETAEALGDAAKTSTWMGILTVIVGIIALGSPFATGVALTYMIAILLIIGGITRSIYAFKAGSLGKGILMLAFGGITVLAGLAVFSNPALGLATITIILFFYFLIDGITGMILAFQMKPEKGWGVLLTGSIISLLLAIAIYRNWPYSAAGFPGILVGINLLFSGITMLAIGSTARDVRDAVAASEPAPAAAAPPQSDANADSDEGSNSPG